MVKIVTLFLILVAVMAMFGKLRMPKIFKRKTTELPRAEKCKKCGATKFKGVTCACEGKK